MALVMFHLPCYVPHPVTNGPFAICTGPILFQSKKFYDYQIPPFDSF